MDPDGGGEKECGEKPNRRAARVDAGKRAAAVTPGSPREGAAGSPCGACKFLRRKCLPGCVFAAHFASEQGPARFAAVHKVFGASNVSKLLSIVPAGRQHDAVVTICYEAQARLADPVYGCVSTILAMQQQVSALQAELSMVHSQLLNTRLAVASVLRASHRAQHMAALQPAYSNNSSASRDMVDVGSFPESLDLGDTDPASRDLEPLQLLQQSQDEEEDASHDSVAFRNEPFVPK
ncbi:LOB domain-containing protein 20 [Musa acuminata AAA Group]|uniref:LOB domain-containing protein 20 n=1 Tax=Musa acuminata AAA Group TaxID=214697 RepID=UPI0031CEA31A